MNAPGTRQVFDALTDPLVLVGEDDRVTLVNPASREAFPLLKLDMPYWLVLRDPGFRETVDQARMSGRASMEHVERGTVERRFQITVVHLGQGLVLLHFADRTQVWQAERMRSDFIANASHELRTPLASLLGFIETLEGPARDDPAARTRFLAIMQHEGRRMARLIDDLLSLSRVEMSQHIPPRDHVPLIPVVQSVIDALGPQASASGVTVRFEKQADPVVIGHRDELVRVVENLLENAIRYGKEKGTVVLSVSMLETPDGKPHRGRITVSDDGPGIDAKDLPRLTERFYRTKSANGRHAGGTGLGLALVKHIVNRHRGQLKITSKPGEGTQFTVSIPAAKPA